MPNKKANAKLDAKKPKTPPLSQTKQFAKLKRRANEFYTFMFETLLVGIPTEHDKKCVIVSAIEMHRLKWLMYEAREQGFSEEDLSKRMKRDTKHRQKLQGSSANVIAIVDSRLPPGEVNFFKL